MNEQPKREISPEERAKLEAQVADGKAAMGELGGKFSSCAGCLGAVILAVTFLLFLLSR